MKWMRPSIQSALSDVRRAAVKLRYGSRRIKSGAGRDLYRTRFGDLFWLTPSSYVDKCIIESGVFEDYSTAAVRRLVKPGDVVLDVGANIGYYSVLLSKLVGPDGRVLCFEPTRHFREVLERNLRANRVANATIFPVGLSNRRQQLEIEIGDSSASLHAPDSSGTRARETIDVVSLDEFATQHGIDRIDFIKIDVDGHEPLFLEGGWQTILKFRSTLLLEISHLHYLQAGVTAWDFYDSVKSRGFHIYHEDGLVEILDKNTFLVRCANFAFSSNIVLSQKPLDL